ncbi:MAG TPA: glycosyltransferase family 39 protein [Actinomycetota bacterium]|nr:glycosyltransferase family 39 protein [Actinomycetota bacterium]
MPELRAPAAGAAPSGLRRTGGLPDAVRQSLSSPRAPLYLLLCVGVASLVTRLAWISTPRVLLFDENYYVNAARRMLGIRLAADQIYAASPAGLDPNFAHPPLGKLLIAMGVRSLGDNPLGWRFASILFGTYAIAAIYWLARSAGFGSWVALGASALMAADTMFFVHGRIGTLEILVLVFMLAGCAVYLNGRPGLAGVVLGVGACVKLVALFLLVVLAIFELFRAAQQMSSRPLSKLSAGERLKKALPRRVGVVALTAVTSVASYLAVLWLLDLRFTNFRNPVEHTRVMVTSIQDSGIDNSIIDMGPQATGSTFRLATAAQQPVGPVIRQEDQDLYLAPHSSPWEWLVNQKGIPYYKAPSTRGEVRSWSQLGLWTTDSIHFQALVNPVILAVAIPSLAYTTYLAWRRRKDGQLLPLAWFLGIWGLLLAIYFVRRTSAGHIYYMVIVLPAVYVAVAQAFSASALAVKLRPWFAAGVVAAFFAYYPFKTWGGR